MNTILDSTHVEESNDVSRAVEDAQERPTFQRIDPTDTMRRMVRDSMRDLLMTYPLIGSFASSDVVHYHAISADDQPMAMTDGAAVYFNAASQGWFDGSKWNADNRVFVHAHEVLHIMREDCVNSAMAKMLGSVSVPRTPTCPEGRLPFKEQTMQLACDAIINSALICDRVGRMPEGGFTHPSISWSTSTGEAYAILWQEDQQNQQQNQQGPGQGGQNPQGQGAPNQPQKRKDPMGGDQQAPGSMGDPQGDSSADASQPTDAAQALKSAQAGAGDRALARERAESMARNQGFGSTYAEQMIKAANAPGVDWRSYFQGFLARAAGNSAYNWKRPSRPPLLRDEPYFMPSRAGHGANHIVWVGDTSGSIQRAEHEQALAALVEMLADINPRTLSVVWCDSQVQRVDVFTGNVSSDTIDDYYARNPIPNGGGTSFVPPFEMIDSIMQGGTLHVPDNMPSHQLADLLEAGEPDGLAYFTDLEGRAPDKAPSYPVLWVATTKAHHPWGDRVTVDPKEM